MSHYEDLDFEYLKAVQRKQRAQNWLKNLLCEGEQLQPLKLATIPKNIAKSFWGKAWCKHISTYEDMSYRASQGRSYLRTQSILHFEINGGRVGAKVLGGTLYDVEIKFEPVADYQWSQIKEIFSGNIVSLASLLKGKIPDSILNQIVSDEGGLFPGLDEVHFSCSCLDYAVFCEHSAAVLYALGIQFDQDASLFFSLRGVSAEDLICLENCEHNPNLRDESINADLEQLFDIELI